MAHVLVVEAEQSTRKFLRISLTANGYTVTEAQSAAECLAMAQHRIPDLILLSLVLPDGDGQDVITTLREQSDVQIIALSTAKDEITVIEALDRGADDFVVKPISIGELMARVRVALRHALPLPSSPTQVDCTDLNINLVQKKVSRQGRNIRLTKREFGLLQTLASHPNHVLSHQEIIDALWNDVSFNYGLAYLRTYIKQLRSKLEVDPSNPSIIITEPGIGYRLRADF